MRILLAGVAALSLATAGAHADPGKGKGHGNSGQQHAAPAKADRGKADRPSARPEAKAERGPQKKAAQPQSSRKVDPRGADRRITREVERRPVVAHDRKTKIKGKAPGTIDRIRVADPRNRDFIERDHSRSLIAGCPPGLARKNNGCLPPGQAKRSFRSTGWHGYDYRPSLFGLNSYASGQYYYSNGYLLRPSSNGGIAGYIPLLGGALSIGNVWPSDYQSYAVPDYYVDYYDLGPAQSYRYADDVIYRVDPGDAAIASVAALLTGDDFVIGQPMPSGYDVYNVPYSYRNRYADTNDAWYRYSDGYVYRVDPETQLVAAAIDLLI